MIRSISVNNFLNITEKITLSISPKGQYQVVFGKNSVGKTTFYNALKTAQKIYLEGISHVPREWLYRLKKFDFGFDIVFEYLAHTYKFTLDISFSTHEVKKEALTILDKQGKDRIIIFSRENQKTIIGHNLDRHFSDNEIKRLKTFIYDYAFDKTHLLTTNLRNKDFAGSRNLFVFSYLYETIKKMIFFYNDEQVYFLDKKEEIDNPDIIKAMQIVDKSIVDVEINEITVDDLRTALNRHRYDDLMESLIFRSAKYDMLYTIVYAFGKVFLITDFDENFKVHTFSIIFEDGSKVPFDYLPKGLKYSISTVVFLNNISSNALLIMDHFSSNIDLRLTSKIVSFYRYRLERTNSQGIFFTHIPELLDDNIFYQYEINFLRKKETICLDCFLSIKIRRDKKLSNFVESSLYDEL